MAVKKQWYEIKAPELFGGKTIGETPSMDLRKIGGRVIEVNLMELERNYRRFFIKLKFRIIGENQGVLETEFIGHSTMNERVYKMVQRRSRRVDAIENVETKDGQKSRLKVILIIDGRVNTTIKKAVRKKTGEIIAEIAGKSKFRDFINDVISGKVNETIIKDMKKVYPCSDVEIRASKIMK